MRKILETYTYANFKEGLSKWLKSGNMLFYVYGNYGAPEAIKLVE